MSYTPTEWKSGDVITAEKLNHIEEGIENAGSSAVALIISPLDVTQEGHDLDFDKTFAEVDTAFRAGIPCLVAQEYTRDTDGASHQVYKRLSVVATEEVTYGNETYWNVEFNGYVFGHNTSDTILTADSPNENLYMFIGD